MSSLVHSKMGNKTNSVRMYVMGTPPFLFSHSWPIGELTATSRRRINPYIPPLPYINLLWYNIRKVNVICFLSKVLFVKKSYSQRTGAWEIHSNEPYFLLTHNALGMILDLRRRAEVWVRTVWCLHDKQSIL